MAVRTVLLLGDPRLRESSTEVSDFGEPTTGVVDDLRDTLRYLRRKTGLGRAIAAPQIGRFEKILFVDLPQMSFSMVNPEITMRSDETFQVWDSCFCFDLAFFIQVTRHRELDVSFCDEWGQPRREHFSGDMSELIQHEIDHLDGILATDRMSDTRKIMMRSEWEKMA